MIATYPTNSVLTHHNNFFGNVPSSQFNEAFEEQIILNENVLKTIKSNKYLTQKDFNVLKVIMREWLIQGKKNTFIICLDDACNQLGLISKKYSDNKDDTINGNKIISNNQYNNHNRFYDRVTAIMSFVVTVEQITTKQKTSFHYIDNIEMSKGGLEVKLNDKFIKNFLVKKLQNAQMLFIDGEYNQKVLDFLITQVQTKQNLVGIHKGRESRFKNFEISQLLKYMKLENEYLENTSKIKRHISKALKEIYLKFKNNKFIAIPKYKLKRSTDTFQVDDYNY